MFHTCATGFNAHLKHTSLNPYIGAKVCTFFRDRGCSEVQSRSDREIHSKRSLPERTSAQASLLAQWVSGGRKRHLSLEARERWCAEREKSQANQSYLTYPIKPLWDPSRFCFLKTQNKHNGWVFYDEPWLIQNSSGTSVIYFIFKIKYIFHFKHTSSCKAVAVWN